MIDLRSFKYPTLSPSILSMDKEKPAEEIDLIRKSGMSFVHIDVMDGKFVPNKSFTDEAIKQIVLCSNGLVKDVHIMVEEPWNEISRYASLGSDLITFHYEACPDEYSLRKTINAIREKGIKVGVSICPDTDPGVLDSYLEEIDLVLVMSVWPGRGGQKFIDNCLDKIKYLKSRKKELVVEVDGGINKETSKLVREAGVDLLVSGSYLFGHEDFIDRAKGLLE